MLEPATTAQSIANPVIHRPLPTTPLPQTASAKTSAALAIDSLLWRMQAGDREAAAQFLLQYGSRIRRRIRGKLGPAIRKLFDSMDILSTIGRRLDLYVMSGRLDVATEAQLWSLLFKMADHAMVDKTRIFNSLQAIEGEDGEFAHDFARRLRQADRAHTSGAELELDKCLRLLTDPIDRQILSMWLVGQPYASIAEMLDISVDLVRKRWERIKSHLKSKFRAGAT